METPQFLQKEAAKAVIVDPATGKALIVRLNQAERDQRGIDEWHIPGGCREPEDASLEDTAIREVREEVGLTVRIVRSIGHAAWNALYDGEPAHFEAEFFEAEVVAAGSVVTLDTLEIDDVAWVGRADLDGYPALTPEARKFITFVLSDR